MPEGKTGNWIIGGRKVVVRQRTELDEDRGPFRVGACVEVEYDDREVEELETKQPERCQGR